MMPRYEIAHIREQGQEILLFALNQSFGHQSEKDQLAALDEFSRRCRGANLRGSVAILWPAGAQTRFIGPQNWHHYLGSINLAYAISRRNRWISW
jgi:hypothetical protein